MCAALPPQGPKKSTFPTQSGVECHAYAGAGPRVIGEDPKLANRTALTQRECYALSRPQMLEYYRAYKAAVESPAFQALMADEKATGFTLSQLDGKLTKNPIAQEFIKAFGPESYSYTKETEYNYKASGLYLEDGQVKFVNKEGKPETLEVWQKGDPTDHKFRLKRGEKILDLKITEDQKERLLADGVIEQVNIPGIDHYVLNLKNTIIPEKEILGGIINIQTKILDAPEDIGTDKKPKQRLLEGKSFYKFINLYMGIDNDNNPITKDHELYEAHIAVKTEMGKTSAWGHNKFDQAHFAQYQLAASLQRNPGLKAKFINAFEAVDVLGQSFVRDSDYEGVTYSGGKPVLEAKHLQCEDQRIALLTTQFIRACWGTANNGHEVFADIMDIAKEYPAYKKGGFGAKNIKTKLTEADFFTAWGELLADMKAHNPEVKNFAWFDGHGCVFSTDPDLIAEQKESHMKDPAFLDLIGGTFLDSLPERSKPFFQIEG